MKILGFFLALALMAAMALAQGETTSASGSSIRIMKIQPSIAQPLRPGEKVTFVVELEYTLAAEAGSAALIIQRAESGSGALAYADTTLSKGSGNVVLQAEIRIPATRTMSVYTPLYHAGGGPTSVVDSRVFEVEAN